MPVPVTVLPTLEFVCKNNRSVSMTGTLASVIRRAPEYVRSLRRLKAIVRELQPDVLLNFFEPLTGIYAMTSRRRPPIVTIGHQFMFEHPDYIRVAGVRMQQFGMKWFVRLVGSASTRLALSLYEAADMPEKSLFVCPPLLRKRLFELEPNPNGSFTLVYLLNHGYAGQIIKWHEANPKTALHCFYDKPGALAESRHDDTLTFHRLDGEKFLRMMAECRNVVCTAGFESVSEAAYLGKPLFMVPVENHVEQQINALDAVKIGLGVTDSRFNLDKLSELPDKLNNGTFRNWIARAESILLRAIQDAVNGTASEALWHKPTLAESKNP
jgi:uncharacterized protein (TIGR00661 family)